MKLVVLIATLVTFSGTAYASGLSRIIGHTHTTQRPYKPSLFSTHMAPLKYSSRFDHEMTQGFELTRQAVKTGGRTADQSVRRVLGKPTPSHKENIQLFERNVYEMALHDDASLQSKIVSWNIGHSSEASMLVIRLNGVSDTRLAQNIARSMGHGSIVRHTSNTVGNKYQDIEVITYLHAGDFEQIIRTFKNVLNRVESGNLNSTFSRTNL